MAWNVEFSNTALKALKKLDKSDASRILDFLENKVAKSQDPTIYGKGLTGLLATFWRYRVQDMRIICLIDKDTITVLVLRIAHRSKAYVDEKGISDKAKLDVKNFRTKKQK